MMLKGHKVLKAIGDAHRALMDKNGSGKFSFTLYTIPNSVVTAGESGKNKGKVTELGWKQGTAFIPQCELCNGRYLLTNKHVTDSNKIKKEATDAIGNLVNFPPGVTLHLGESYKAVDVSGITFLVFVVAVSTTDDIALLRFDKKISPMREGFVLQDESEISFSLLGLSGSPFGISDTLRTGSAMKVGLNDCNDPGHKYFLVDMFISSGNSGGALYNFESDKVNGMIARGDSTGIACGVPASALIKFLKETLPLRKKAEMVSGG